MYYATTDAIASYDEDGYPVMTEAVENYRMTFFFWTYSTDPPAPESSELSDILIGINALGVPYTITLLWEGPVDFDLGFNCQAGSDMPL